MLERVDAAVGDGLERAMVRHHARRLRRQGRLHALIPTTPGLWAETAVPPRDGNSMEVLIDGANALPAMAEAIRGAQRHVHVCSWHMEPDFEPEHSDEPVAEGITVELAQWQ